MTHNEKPASPTQGELAVKVKPLEWRENISMPHVWHADRYIIRVDRGEPDLYIVSGWDRGTNPYETLEAAKAAAQADFEARILSALDRTILPPTAWQPIETAPKDGTFIITRVGRWTRPAVVHWATYEDVTKWGADPEHFMEEDHFCQYWLEVKYDPTEWLPLEALDAFPAPQGTRS